MTLYCFVENIFIITVLYQKVYSIIYSYVNPFLLLKLRKSEITIYATMIYTAPCIMFWNRAYLLQGQVGGGWALDFKSFLGPCENGIEPIGECTYDLYFPLHNVLDACISTTRASGRGLGPGIQEFLEPCENGIEPIGECTYDLYSPVHNVLDVCISTTRASGRGLGPGIQEFFGAL